MRTVIHFICMGHEGDAEDHLARHIFFAIIVSTLYFSVPLSLCNILLYFILCLQFSKTRTVNRILSFSIEIASVPSGEFGQNV